MYSVGFLPHLEKSSSEKVAAEFFILQVTAEPLSSTHVWGIASAA
jgi:hypothetical protein